MKRISILLSVAFLAAACGKTPPSPAPPAPAAVAPAPAPVLVPAPEAEPEEGSSPRRVRWMEVAVDPLPAPAEKLAKAGAGVYKQNCLVCHGAEGKGNGPAADLLASRPRDFTGGMFKFKTSAQGEMPFDDDLYRTISSGVAAAGMPSFGDLTPFERWALVAQVKALSKFTTEDGETYNHFELKPAVTRLPAQQAPDKTSLDMARGEKIFRDQAQCLKCHGERGLGDGPSAAGLKDALDHPIQPADLTRGEVSFKTGYQVDDIYRVLTIGMAGTPMPAFTALSDEERWILSYYVTGLYRPIDPGEKLFLRVGCTSCHTVGKGKLIGPDLAGVTGRRKDDWLKKWLKDPPTMIATDDAARQLLAEYLTPMPSYGLTEREVNRLIEYLKTLPPAPAGAK